MGKWKLERAPELVPVPIDPELHKQNLAEIAEILYPYFCQLDPKFKSLIKTPNPELQTDLGNKEVRKP
jgi:hypothetical protein